MLRRDEEKRRGGNENDGENRVINALFWNVAELGYKYVEF